MHSWVPEPRIANGQEATYVRTLKRHLEHFRQAHAGGSALASTEWETLAQDCAGWRPLVTERPFDVFKPLVWPPQRNARVLPEDKRRIIAQWP